MEYANNIAKIIWSDTEKRFELIIFERSKAYTRGSEPTKEAHEEGKAELIEIANTHGYTVIEP